MLVCVILLKYCIYLYIYYVPATKLCNKDKFSLKMLRRTIKVFYIYIRPLHLHIYSILNIRPLNVLLIKKSSNNYMPDLPLAGTVSLSFQYGEFAEFVKKKKANTRQHSSTASAGRFRK